MKDHKQDTNKRVAAHQPKNKQKHMKGCLFLDLNLIMCNKEKWQLQVCEYIAILYNQHISLDSISMC